MPTRPAYECTVAQCRHRIPCPLHAKKSWATTILSRQLRGYGKTHTQWRTRVLRQEPFCRICTIRPAEILDHITPIAFGGKTVRSNLQGLCRSCSQLKTNRESHQSQRKNKN